jgi:hypothetical protein
MDVSPMAAGDLYPCGFGLSDIMMVEDPLA